MPTIGRLFLRFSARYQRAWTSLFPSPQAFEVALTEWALILDGVNTEGIERALRRCLVEYPTSPPKPAEFLALTAPTPEELGLPSLEDALRAALAQRWRSHPLVWHVVSTIGQYEFLRLSHDQACSRFRAVYPEWVAYVAEQRRDDPDFSLQLPETQVRQIRQETPPKVTAPGDARSHLATIRKKLRLPCNYHRG